MSKRKPSYSCAECGNTYQKWQGQCNSCGSWDSITEDVAQAGVVSFSKQTGNVLEFASLDAPTEHVARMQSGVSEFDRVLGGGIVPGSAVLIGGDPGIGKSTLLLQITAAMASGGHSMMYVSGEESLSQIRLRAERLGVSAANVQLLAATSVEDVMATIAKAKKGSVLVVDSIQTMYMASVGSTPGSVSQIRATAHEFITYAKTKGITVFLIGHVTKDGQIAGPKLLEHMVDTVLYFEGERGHQFRLLRSVKNRFGAANEIGVFEMQREGLCEVTNPAGIFLPEHAQAISGSVVFPGLEGTRPMLVEIQALVCQSNMATPRRAVVGWDMNRLAMVVAILGTRYGLNIADKEIYLNVAGGMRINEPAADLAVAAALVSAVSNKPLPNKCVVMGELGLSGEVRAVSQLSVRLNEAQKLGFESAIIPGGGAKQNKSFQIHPISHIKGLSQFLESRI